MLERWGAYVARRHRLVLRGTLLVLVAFAALAPLFLSRLLGIAYDTPGSESYRATQLIEERLGAQEAVLLVVSSPTGGDGGVLRAMDEAVRVATATRGVASVPPAELGGAVSADGRVAYRAALLSGHAGDRQNTSTALKHALDDLDLAAAQAEGVEVGLTGESPFFVDLLHSEEEGLILAEAIGLPLAMLVLFLTLGSILAAGLPILVGLAGAVVALGVLGAASLFTTFDVFAENGVVMLGLAVGIDYALLIVRRYREELSRHGLAGIEAAMATTMATAGRTALFSGVTVVVALLPMWLIDVPTLSKYAMAGLLGVAGSVAMALTLLPALLVRSGNRVLTVRLKKLRERGFADGGASLRWALLARWVMRRSWAVLAAGVGLLVLCALPLLGAKQGIDLNARAYADAPSVRALTTVGEAFPGTTLSKVEVAVLGGPDARAATTALIAADPRFAPGVEVLDLGDRALITAGLTVPDDSKEAEDAVGDLRAGLSAALPAGTEAAVGGTTARSVDYADVVLSKTVPVVAGTLALCFLLLLVMLRSPLLAVKAVVMNLMSIAAAMGLTVLVFQDGLGEGLLDFTSPGYLQAWLPLTLFVVLFGLSMDYEVFLVSRMREEWQRTGSNDLAVENGLAKTGGVITSAALIMIAIFGAFTICPAPEIKQLGFGLAAAVLIDATIVRAMLVPAFMRLAGTWNWWCPAWLDRVLPDLSERAAPVSVFDGPPRPSVFTL
ncbi:MAG: MMPL family transporter [Sporichthyaceae bacterium]